MNISDFIKLRSSLASDDDSILEHGTILCHQAKICTMYGLLQLVKNVTGDMAECGVFKGGSLKLIATLCPERKIHGFDTFEGLPPPDAENKDGFAQGQFSCSLEETKRYLSGLDNITLHKGLFPASGEPVKDLKFSFVHLDMDHYKSTKDGLEFFYQRMNPGAILLCDDYGHQLCPGVEKVFENFFMDKPESYIPVGLRQVFFAKQ